MDAGNVQRLAAADEVIRLLGEAEGVVRTLADGSDGDQDAPEWRDVSTAVASLRVRVEEIRDGAVGADAEDTTIAAASEVGDPADDSPVVLPGFDVMYGDGNAFWTDGSLTGTVSLPAVPSPDYGDDWSFGVDWHENVARHVPYVLAGDGSGPVSVLFYEGFDENAVDVLASDGRTHVVFVQGLVPGSLEQTWRGVLYKSRRKLVGDGDAVTAEVPELTFPVPFGSPSLEIRGRGAGDDAGDVTQPATETDPDADDAVCFNDTFDVFLYTAPYDGYDAAKDLEDAPAPVAAAHVADIKGFCLDAERLLDYDPMWGKDVRS